MYAKASRRICSPLILIVLVSMIPVSVSAVTLEVIPNRSRVTFKGYSTLHNFTGETDRVSGRVRGLDNLDFRQLEERPRAYFYVGVRSITTHNESRDEEMYDRLRTNRFPRIEYRLNRAQVVEHGDTSFVVDARGVMAVAGVPRRSWTAPRS
ncbi:MAG: YceI family protein, partial [bacterium]